MSDRQARRIRTEPDPFEPYFISQGFQVGNVIYLSGQAAISETGEIVGAGDFDAQAEQTMRNIQRVLEAAGSSLSRVFKVTIYLTDMTQFPRVMELRQKWFRKPYPADTIVEVRSLALPELLIEIDATALVEGELVDA
jgi:2-iminobutanoate/2-iminopropanoate deaminase